jgi:hypothetical protein
MTEAQFDRRLRDWLADREPGPVPPSLREGSARVAFETPPPAMWRVWPAIVRPAGLVDVGRGGGRGAALAFVLLVVGLIVAAAVVAVGASRTPPPAPVLAAWGSFVIGRPAPAIVMHNVAGTPPVGDDSTFEFDDRAGWVVVVYLPSDGDADAAASDVAALVAARERASGGVLFLVATAEPAAAIPAVSGAADAGIGAVQLPVGWAGGSEPARAAAVVVIGRRGTVAATFAGALPGPDQLVDVIDREVGP